MTAARIAFSLISVIGIAADGSGRSQATFGEEVELLIHEPERDKTLQRAQRSVEKSGGSIVSGPSIFEADVIKVTFKVPKTKLETVLNELRSNGKLEHFRRWSRATTIDEELGRVNNELSSLVLEKHPTAAAILNERKAALEEERRRIDSWAQVLFSLRTSTVGFVAPTNTSMKVQAKSWKWPPRAVLSALAEDDRLNVVPAFAESLADVLEAGGIKVERVKAFDTSVKSIVEALDKDGSFKAEFFIAASSELTADSMESAGQRHRCSGHASMAVRAKGRSTTPVITTRMSSAEGQTREEACSQAGAQTAAALASVFDQSGDLWNAMPPAKKKDFLRKLSALRRLSLRAP